MITSRLDRRRSAGQATLEYVVALAVAAFILAGVALALYSPNMPKVAADAYCKVGKAVGASLCPTAPEVNPPDKVIPDPPWYCRWFGIGCPEDPDHPKVDIPEGLDPNSEIVKTLMSTQRGRDTLQWMADHDVLVVFDPKAKGAYWDGKKIVIGPGYEDPAVIVHEANHARYTKEGRHADVNNPDRNAYVHGAVDEEVDGTVQQIRAAKEFRDAGHAVNQAPGEAAYDRAYSAAKSAGKSDAEAQQAGYAAVSDEFYSGRMKASTNGKNYLDFYGDYWDQVH